MYTMKLSIWPAITFLSCWAATVISAAVNDIVVLSDMQEFDNAINSNQLVLLKFFAPWCPHSQALKPEYEKAATDLQTDNIMLAEVDCTVNEDICGKYNVQGYPTLQIFRHGRPSDIYNSGRDSDSIVKYMRTLVLCTHALVEYSLMI